MTWTKLSDDFTDRPETLNTSRSARLLNIEALVWSNRHLTDGRIPFGVLARITDSAEPLADVAELILAEEWTPTDAGWQLDWSDQESAEVVQLRQSKRQKTQKLYRDRKSRHDDGNHTLCHAPYCKNVTDNVTDNATHNVTRYETPPRPVPSRPVPKGQGQDEGADESAEQARQSATHQWKDDDSGLSCALCQLPQTHANHTAA